MRLQQLTNTGSTPLYVPYTLAINNPSYALIAGQAWNWGASGSATNGTFSGPVTMVRIPDIPVNLPALIVSSHGCSLGAPCACRTACQAFKQIVYGLRGVFRTHPA